jgi:hypothetical protein
LLTKPWQLIHQHKQYISLDLLINLYTFHPGHPYPPANKTNPRLHLGISLLAGKIEDKRNSPQFPILLPVSMWVVIPFHKNIMMLTSSLAPITEQSLKVQRRFSFQKGQSLCKFAYEKLVVFPCTLK